MLIPNSYQGAKLVHSWTYRDAEKSLVGVVGRYEDKDKKKQTVPFFKHIDGKLSAGVRVNHSQRLFNLENLDASTHDKLFIVEGEKCAAALMQLGYCVTTSQGGSSAAARSDWSPASGFEEVVIWKDNDECGTKYALEVRDYLVQLNPDLTILEIVTGNESGSDCVDWIQEYYPSWDGYSDLPLGVKENLSAELKVLVSKASEISVPWSQIQTEVQPPDFERVGFKLPERLQEYCEAVAISTEVSFEYCAAMALSVVSVLCQQIARVQVKADYFEPLNLWIMSLLESGNRKSPVLKRLAMPVHSIERDLAKSVEAERTHVETNNKILIQQIKALTRKIASAKGDTKEQEEELGSLQSELKEIPSIPQLIAGDVTPEAAALLLYENNGYLAIVSDEGGVFDNINGKYLNGVPNLDVFLQGYSGSPVKVNRVTREPISLDAAYLSFGISPQPCILKELLSKSHFISRGFLARFLMALPISRVGHRSYDTDSVPLGVELRYRSLIDSLWELKGSNTTLRLSNEARSIYLKMALENEEHMREGGRCFNLKDWGNKYMGQVVRVAGVYHLVEHAGEQVSAEISAETFEKAAELGRYFKEHAIFIYNQFSVLDSSLDRLLKWIRSKSKQGEKIFTKRDCHYALKSTFQREEDVRTAINRVVEFGIIRKMHAPKKAARPSELYEINPNF